MASVGRKGEANTLLISLDIIGFVFIFIGAGMIRLSKDEIVAILGGFVLAGGVVVLSITRLIRK